MIEEVTMYVAVCDKCGRRLNVDGVVSGTEQAALEDACCYGWKEINGRLLCPDCYEEELKNDNE